MRNLIKLTQDTFEHEVLESDVPVLVDFWAYHCEECEAIRPLLNSLAGDFEGRIKFASVNVDDEPAIGARYMINEVPTLILFRDGVVADKDVNFLSKGAIKAELERTVLAGHHHGTAVVS